jgi:hypothetical protein
MFKSDLPGFEELLFEAFGCDEGETEDVDATHGFWV